MSKIKPYEAEETPDYFVPTQAISPDSSQSQAGGAATPAEAEATPGLDPLTVPQVPSNSRLPRNSNPILDPSRVPDSEIAKNEERAQNILNLQISRSALARQYDDIIEQLRSQYSFAETPEEKARLKYMLADIELEFDAANQSINDVYELRSSNVAGMQSGVLERSRAEGQRAGQYFTDLASSMESQAGAIQGQVAGEFQGLGVESAERAVNEWTMLIRSFSPIQQTYIEDQGRRTINDLVRINASMDMQEAAQIAALQRAKTATVNSAQYRHMERVEQRIENEKADARARITGIMMDKLARLQSAAEFNAGLVMRAQEQRDGASDPQEFYGSMVNFAAAHGSGPGNTDPNAFLEAFQIFSGGNQPDDTIWRYWLNNSYETQYGIVQSLINEIRQYRSDITAWQSNGPWLQPLLDEAIRLYEDEAATLAELEALRRETGSR